MKIKAKINQVTPGLQYNGNLTTDRTSLTYTLRFGVPLAQLDSIEKPPEEDPMAFARRMFIITLKKGDADIEIPNELFSFLLFILGEFAIDFHNHSQTRDVNEKFLPENSRGKELLQTLGAQLSVGMEREYDFLDAQIPQIFLAA